MVYLKIKSFKKFIFLLLLLLFFESWGLQFSELYIFYKNSDISKNSKLNTKLRKSINDKLLLFKYNSAAKHSINNVKKQTNYLVREELKKSFLRLTSTSSNIVDKGTKTTINYVNSPLIPLEISKQIWLQRHHKNHNSKFSEKHIDRSLFFLKGKNEVHEHRKFTALKNISLLQQHNTCRGDYFKNNILMAGCIPKVVINMFCHGSCSSFYIPRSRSKKLKATFQSCSACVPAQTEIKMNCPNRTDTEMYRNVMRVKKCACKNIFLNDNEEEENELYNDKYY